jgi:hypothetical protein
MFFKRSKKSTPFPLPKYDYNSLRLSYLNNL